MLEGSVPLGCVFGLLFEHVASSLARESVANPAAVIDQTRACRSRQLEQAPSPKIITFVPLDRTSTTGSQPRCVFLRAHPSC
jgi:hypothetical protein